jgi:hypothetical protein
VQSTINISGKIIGKTRPLFNDRSISLPIKLFDRGQSITLRDLLTQIVLQEVEAFHERSQQKSLIQILTKEAIDSSLKLGKIDSGGREIEPQKVDPQIAVENALLAFEDGFYFVFIDDKPQEKLDSAIDLRPNSQMLFLRLVPLVGG